MFRTKGSSRNLDDLFKGSRFKVSEVDFPDILSNEIKDRKSTNRLTQNREPGTI
jgi:hypothetical protein